MVIQRQQWDKWQNKQTNKKNQPPERIYMLAAAAGSTGSDTEGRGDHPTKWLHFKTKELKWVEYDQQILSTWQLILEMELQSQL